MTPLAQIAIPCPLSRLFTYQVPQSFHSQLKPGMRVTVPFRNKPVIGFCLGLTAQLPLGFEEKDLKTILEIKEKTPVFSETMLSLIQWLADYYCAPIGEVCRSALPPKLSQLKAPSRAQPRLKEEDHLCFHQAEPLQLTADQQKVFDQLLSHTKETQPKPILLHGITGSGKTEIYLRFLEKILAEGKQAILLTPEIALTPQLIGRVQSRLKTKIAIYHSGISEAWRQCYWEKMRRGEIGVVVGTRSALFAPFPNLGAIVVDEEEDPSYKQGEGSFHYHARDTAIVRAKLEGAQVILGSATPSLETFHNAKKGKYHYLYLPKRATGAKLPQIELVDLRKTRFVSGSKNLSPILKEAIAENLYRGEQSLLFLNRRGFANFLMCEDCGEVVQCPNCSISLTYHKYPAGLTCHYCEHRTVVPQKCKACASTALKLLGQGTQSLEEELKQFFPEARIARLDRDSAVKRAFRQQTLEQMKKGKVDILLGTQIVAKGHDFENVTLVGVILADTALHLPDFRAGERTFQILTQVAGRSGRGQRPGKVLIQTFQPEHFSLYYSQRHDFENFSARELQSREALHYPPFSRLAQIRLQASQADRVEQASLTLKQFLSQFGVTGKSFIDILGPVQAPLAKLKGKHRWQILVKAGNAQSLQRCLKQVRTYSQKNLPASVQIQIDVDCLDMM